MTMSSWEYGEGTALQWGPGEGAGGERGRGQDERCLFPGKQLLLLLLYLVLEFWRWASSFTFQYNPVN